MADQIEQCEIRSAIITIGDKEAFLQRIQTIARQHGTHLICFNADIMAGRRHAMAAVMHALRSFRGGVPISNSLEMEALLYAASSRQCNIAASFGIHEGENHLYVCCFPAKNSIWDFLSPLMHFVDESWNTIDLQKHARLMVLFGITAEELAAAGNDRITDIVLERIALLEVNR